MKMLFFSESSYTELIADKGYTWKVLAQNIVNNRMSASKKMCENDCNSEEKLSLEKIWKLKLSKT